jgi:2-amino-4-hydroxy-6-hydroxymethyldihydropteridine diphosphokinase
LKYHNQKNSLVYVALGSNCGKRIENIKKSFQLIQQFICPTNFLHSSLYLTTPVSSIDQDLYINTTCCFQTELNPFDLFDKLQAIESKIGKTISKYKDAPRIIDLDILFYQGKCIETPTLTIPHPRWHQRLFVISPLIELTETIEFISKDQTKLKVHLPTYLQYLGNPHQEVVKKLPITFSDKELEKQEFSINPLITSSNSLA